MSSPAPRASPAPTSPPSNTTSPAPTSPPSNTTSPPVPAPVLPPPPARTSPPPIPAVSNPPPTSPPPSPSPPAPSNPPPSSTPSLSPPPPSTPPPSSTPSPSPPAPSTPPPSSTPSPPITAPPPSTPSSNPPPGSPAGGGSPPPPSGAGTPPAPHGRRFPPPPSGRVSPHTPPPSATSGSPQSSGGGISTGAAVGIAIGGVLLLLILSLMFICCKKKKKRRQESDHYLPPPLSPDRKADPYGGGPVHNRQQNAPLSAANHMIKPLPPPAYISSSGGYSSNSGTETVLPPPSPGMSLGFSKSTFSYEELAMATDGFSDANLLGQGGFGYVHKGILPNGKEVAVKQLKVGSGQGEREFQAEVEIISRVHHKHLVSLVGYSMVGVQRMLVYEYVPNNTLEFHLHGKGRPVMNWSTRMRIALGAAKGLAYLHEDCHPKIIHRDIKASNILLEYNFEAKVADFGLAKFFSDTNTHVSTRVMGTFGYLAPEYASSGKLTEKSDVFSYGVMLLELITGRRPVSHDQSFMDDSLVDWARPLLTRALEDGNFDVLVDERIKNDHNHNEMARVVACAAACVRHSSRRRPKLSQVVRALEGDLSLSSLDEVVRHGHGHSTESSEYDTFQYNEDMKKFRKMALSSTDQYSSTDQFSNPTSEYGLNPSSSSSEGQQTKEMEMGDMKKETRDFPGSN